MSGLGPVGGADRSRDPAYRVQPVSEVQPPQLWSRERLPQPRDVPPAQPLSEEDTLRTLSNANAMPRFAETVDAAAAAKPPEPRSAWARLTGAIARLIAPLPPDKLTAEQSAKLQEVGIHPDVPNLSDSDRAVLLRFAALSPEGQQEVLTKFPAKMLSLGYELRTWHFTTARIPTWERSFSLYGG